MMDDSRTADARLVRPAPGPGLGAQLQAARTARSLSLAQVAEALRLEEQSVTAMEQERFELLGAPVFSRGHLRRYAELLGLSAEAALEAYRSIVPDSNAMPELSRSRELHEPGRIGPWVWGLVAAVLLITGLLVWTGSGPSQVLSSAAAVPKLDSTVFRRPVDPSVPPPIGPAVVAEPARQPTLAPMPASAGTAAIPAEATAAHSPEAAGGTDP